ncbi:MAG: DinB family protein [Gemmatimonadales bacterium]
MQTFLTYYRSLLQYDDWANAACLEALRRAATAPAQAVKLLAHLIGARRLWLARLRGQQSPLAVWPELGLDACGPELAGLSEDWTAWLGGLTPEDLDRTVSYVNSAGDPWQNSVTDILTHVTHHGAYHRGQIAMLLRGPGLEPPYTDYIHAVRQGLLRPATRPGS